jgi:hypothetical protein
MEFVVTLSNGNGIAFTVNYGTQDGTAVGAKTMKQQAVHSNLTKLELLKKQ